MQKEKEEITRNDLIWQGTTSPSDLPCWISWRNTWKKSGWRKSVSMYFTYSMSMYVQVSAEDTTLPCHTALKNDLLCSLCATSVWPPTTWLPEGHASISEAFRRRAQKRQAMATKSSNVMGGFGKSGFFWANAGGIRGNVCGMFRSIRISSNLIA